MEVCFQRSFLPLLSVDYCNTASDNYLSVHVQRVDLEEAK